MRTNETTRTGRPCGRDQRPLRQALAEAVLNGQRLRADETVSVTTMRLNYAAKWRQATGGVR